MNTGAPGTQPAEKCSDAVLAGITKPPLSSPEEGFKLASVGKL